MRDDVVEAARMCWWYRPRFQTDQQSGQPAAATARAFSRRRTRGRRRTIGDGDGDGDDVETGAETGAVDRRCRRLDDDGSTG